MGFRSSPWNTSKASASTITAKNGGYRFRSVCSCFRKVCAAVTYAHQHLVIHRDIKPGNIRVTPEGEPKLLDFGIARLLDPDPFLGAEQTLTSASAMTPEYASPEQVRGETVSTTSDVYSLGVLLYKLLTGRSPYRTKTGRPSEIAHAITDQEPERPSIVLRNDRRSKVSHYKSVQGDLDKIVLRALRKEPELRYESAADFSEDVRRYLCGLPVLARRATWRYRGAKFARRNRLGVAAAALLLLSFLSGGVATVWQARRARYEKVKAESINAFLEEMIHYTNPQFDLPRPKHHAMTITEALDQAVTRLESGRFVTPPEVRADLERILSGAYDGQGKPVEAMQHLKKFVALQTHLFGANDPRGYGASEARAWILFTEGKLAESEEAFRDVVPRMRQEYRRGQLTAEDLVAALSAFAYLRRTQGDSKEAEQLFREALSLSANLPPELDFIPIVTQSTLASVLSDQGRFAEALRTADECVAGARARGHAELSAFGFAQTILGGFLTEAQHFAEADSALAQGEKILQNMAPGNLWLGDNLRNQAISLYRQNRFAEAQRRNGEALAIYRKNFGPHYDQYPTALITQGLIQNALGQPKEAERILREAVKLRLEFLPPHHFWVAEAHAALGECLTSQGRYAEAEPLLLRSYERLKISQGSDNPRTQLSLRRLIALYQAWEKPEIAGRYRSNLVEQNFNAD